MPNVGCMGLCGNFILVFSKSLKQALGGNSVKRSDKPAFSPFIRGQSQCIQVLPQREIYRSSEITEMTEVTVLRRMHIDHISAETNSRSA